jgi:hypothetical protein
LSNANEKQQYAAVVAVNQAENGAYCQSVLNDMHEKARSDSGFFMGGAGSGGTACAVTGMVVDGGPPPRSLLAPVMARHMAGQTIASQRAERTA